MAKKDDVPPANLIDPAPKPEPKETPTVHVHADIDYDKLAEKVVSKIDASLKTISDPISEMLGIMKPAPKTDPPPKDDPPPPQDKKRSSIIPWFGN